MLDKALILQEISEELGRQLRELAVALQAATDGATDEHARPENKYDTRALELSYLAAGQTERIEALRQVIAQVRFYQPPQGLQAVAPGALLQVQGERLAPWLFVVPFAASMALQVGGAQVQVLSTQAPLARALLGRQSGEVVRFGVGAAQRDVEILSIDGD